MFTSIGVGNFSSEITVQERPVLLAYIRRDYDYREQTEILESLSERYGDKVKVCLLDEDSIGEIRKLGIDGDPTFFVFYKGKERGKDVWQGGHRDIKFICITSFA